MFSKDNSRFLTVANASLLGQVVVGVVYLLFAISQLIFPAGEFRVGNEEWIRALTIAAVGAGLLFVVNRRKKAVFEVGQVREEKIFKLATLAVFDVAACMAISYLIMMPMETNPLSFLAVKNTMTSAAATGVTFLALFLIVPRLKMFRESFSGVLNFILLVILLGMGWSAAWALGVVLSGPDGSSEVTQAVYAQQIFRFAVTAVFLAGVCGVLVKNGTRLSGEKAALRTVARRGQKMWGAEKVAENRELRAEISELKKEVAGLRKELKEGARKGKEELAEDHKGEAAEKIKKGAVEGVDEELVRGAKKGAAEEVKQEPTGETKKGKKKSAAKKSTK